MIVKKSRKIPNFSAIFNRSETTYKARLLQINLVVIQTMALSLEIKFMVIETTADRSKSLFVNLLAFVACLYLPTENWR
jgi:site-specific recombinase